MVTHTDEQGWQKDIKPVLRSKANEFMLSGYKDVTVNDIWKCMVQKVWKNNPPEQVHKAVQDIFRLSTQVYMGYLTISAQKDEDLMSSINALENGKDVIA